MIDVQSQAGSTLKEWDRRITRVVEAQYDCAKSLRKKHYALGVIAFILVSGIASIKETSDVDKYEYLPGILYFLSVVSAILVGLQTFLNYGERAEKHREAGSNYSSIRREIEHIAKRSFSSAEQLEKCMRKMRYKMDSLAKSSPEVSDDIWQRARGKYDKKVFQSKIFD
ncbi:SLATT domain-containing protein [Flavobacterium silvaticum]|uniref:SLATT domain-containing protein n=1 Tax=Flavobacterium silvaticum TaxID=1852020 RepID=A0A972JHS4_9FLAO|nr:SLATT domain-containing protein [Flavobacterium silvaticum]NMH26547.1 SLATT domain-containing protein [Flavobacterium silvaticum]